MATDVCGGGISVSAWRAYRYTGRRGEGMSRIVIIQGHPTPGGGHFCHALAQAYATGAAEGGHDVRHVSVADLDFPILRSKSDWEGAAAPAAIADAQAAIAWAEHLVITYPLWLGGMPALAKGFLEQA